MIRLPKYGKTYNRLGDLQHDYKTHRRLQDVQQTTRLTTSYKTRLLQATRLTTDYKT